MIPVSTGLVLGIIIGVPFGISFGLLITLAWLREWPTPQGEENGKV
jgi:hypothetical protein